MLTVCCDYLSGVVKYIPTQYQREYKEKLFNYLLSLLYLTKDPNDIKVLQSNLISLGNTIKTIDTLKNIYDGTYMGLVLNLDIRDQWRVVFRINASPLYSEQVKERYFDQLRNKDSTDSGKQWSQAIRGLSSDEKEVEEIWRDLISEDTKLSYELLTYLFIGFNYSLSRSYSKHKYINKFFEELPSLLNKR